MTTGEPGRTAAARFAWMLLVAAAVCLVLANGRWQVWPAAWLAPTLLVVFIDSQPPRRGLGAALVVQILAFVVNWWGMIPVPGAWYYLVAGIYALVYFIPFVMHRLLAGRVHGAGATLILPMSWVAIELLFQRLITPYGSWASLAYTQVDNLPLLQLAAVTGTGGISFLILWCASVVASLCASPRTSGALRRTAVVCVVVLFAVLAWGQYRVASAPQGVDTVQVAGITPSATLGRELAGALRGETTGSPGDDAALRRAADAADRLNADLLDRTRRLVGTGAQIVVWSEHAARVTGPAEDRLIADAGALARELGIVLIMGVGVFNPGSSPAFENKVVAIRPDGEVAFTYSKARPIVGSESSLIAPGALEIGSMDSSYGILATVICHDLDFPGFLRAAGKAGAAVLFGPSSDWAEIASLHARMAMVRAVENGCPLVRPCEQGLSAVVDPLGRIVVAAYDRGERGSSLLAPVPLFRIKTAYPFTGDLLGYLSLVGLPVLVLWSRRRSRSG